MLKADNALASISLSDFFNGELQIYTLAFAAPEIFLSRETHDSPLNIKFIIDELSKDKKEKKKEPGIRINQLIIYDGKFSYDVLSEPEQTSNLDPNHIEINGFRCNLSLRNFNKENLNLKIRSVGGKEKSGLELEKLKAHVLKTDKNIELTGLEIQLPESHLEAGNIRIAYDRNVPGSFAAEGDLSSKRLALDDLKPLFTAVSGDIPPFSFEIKGNINKEAAKGSICLHNVESGFAFDADASIQTPYSDNRVAELAIHELRIKEEDINRILTFAGKEMPEIAELAGNASISGKATIEKNEFSAGLALACNSGEVTADLSISSNGNYAVTARGERISLGSITRNKHLEECNLEIDSKGNIFGEGLYADFKANISSLQFKEYEYAPITINGKLGKGIVKASLRSEDRNLTAEADIDYNRYRKNAGSFSMNVSSFSPHNLNLTDNYTGDTFSFNATGSYGHTANKDRITNLKITDLVQESAESKNTLRKLTVSENFVNGQRMLHIDSDFVTGDLVGEFSYEDLAASFSNALGNHLPALVKPSGMKSRSNYVYDITLDNTEFISKLLGLPFTVNSPSSIKGNCDDRHGKIALNAKINDFILNGGEYPKVVINGTNDKESSKIEIDIWKKSYFRKGTPVERVTDTDIKLTSEISNNNIACIIGWKNKADSINEHGSVNLNAVVGKDKNNDFTLNANIIPTDVIRNGALWHISPGEVKGNLERLTVSNLSIYNDTQKLEISGVAGKDAADSLLVVTKDMDVSTLMGFTNFRALHFGGRATGSATMVSLLSVPEVNGKFGIESFRIEEKDFGRGDLGIGWSNKDKAILLECDLYKDQAKTTAVKGFMSQANDTILLRIDADGTEIGLIHNKVRNFITDLEGKAYGTFYVIGSWRFVDLLGELTFSSRMKVKPTNTNYTIENGKIIFTDRTVSFNGITIKDRRGNSGTVSGNLWHKNLNHWTCNLDVDADRMIVYDTNGFGQFPFYGTVYASGKGNIVFQPESGFTLEANLRSEPNSSFVYNSATSSGARDNSFVTFVDRDDKKRRNKAIIKEKSNNSYSSIASKLNLDFMLEINDDFHIKVITNMNTQDYIDFYGKGTVNAIYDEKTGFSMRGGLDLDRGTYKFTIQDIFPKEFQIENSSRLLFEGDPFNAGLDLNTKLHLPSVPLNDLNTETSKNKTAKVNCLMHIGGTLTRPQLTFDIELPEANEEERDLLASVASTQEQKNTQFIYLLGVGKFYTYDYNKAGSSSQSSSAMESLISTTLSGQLNNMLGQIINNDNWDISGNFSTSERGWNRMEVEGMLRGRLLNNRLLINGNFGYRENPIANSSFIGDFELQYFLDPKGIFSLKAYSKTNDRYFTESDLTTQGVGFLTKYDFDRWIFWRKKKKSSNSEEGNKPENEIITEENIIEEDIEQ